MNNRKDLAKIIDGEPVYQGRMVGEKHWHDQNEARYIHMLERPATFEARVLYAAPQPVQTERALTDDTRDAARYRWLRRQHWDEADMFVVAGSKSQVRLGADCPSHDRLDDAIDAALTAAQPANGDKQ